jgi:hypothetical protein
MQVALKVIYVSAATSEHHVTTSRIFSQQNQWNFLNR